MLCFLMYGLQGGYGPFHPRWSGRENEEAFLGDVKAGLLIGKHALCVHVLFGSACLQEHTERKMSYHHDAVSNSGQHNIRSSDPTENVLQSLEK